MIEIRASRQIESWGDGIELRIMDREVGAVVKAMAMERVEDGALIPAALTDTRVNS